MVGHKVDDDLQACLVGACHEGLKFSHSLFDVDGQVGAHVIVVADGVGRARQTFHHVWITRCDALAAVIGGGGMLDDAGVPHVGGAKRLDGAQPLLVNLVKLARSVLSQCSVGDALRVAVGEPAWHQLVDNRFLFLFHAAKITNNLVNS